jgi:acyl-CoA synthetase (AMP-forming)/AMP-acid ligase II/acyl carrier protein
LASGAELVLCPREALVQPERLYQLLRQQAVTCAEFVPAVMRALVEHMEQHALRLEFMRLVLVGSDLWNMAEFAALERLLGPDTRLVNSYGLTEAAIDSTFYTREQGEPVAERPVPIGRPFANTQALVLDEYLQLCARGVPGILYLGGPNLARGYRGDPGLTARKFLPNPFAAAPGQRLYRTDDQVRYLPAAGGGPGALAFLGRADHQVKLRGLRIELGEVEAALAALPSVQRAAAQVKGSGNAALLVGYLVPRPGQTPPEAVAVRDALQRHLPDYMIPGALVVLEQLPLTPNGKIDRKALPEPDRAALTRDLVAPRSDLEARIAAIWCEVLELDEVGVNHNFFDLGGHSLIASRVGARLSRELEQNIPLRLLFEEPTIAALAERLELIQWAAESDREDDAELTLLEEEGSL